MGLQPAQFTHACVLVVLLQLQHQLLLQVLLPQLLQSQQCARMSRAIALTASACTQPVHTLTVFMPVTNIPAPAWQVAHLQLQHQVDLVQKLALIIP